MKCDGNHGGPRCEDPECWNDWEESSTWPVVLAFARLMDARLQENIANGTRGEWVDRDIRWAANRLRDLGWNASCAAILIASMDLQGKGTRKEEAELSSDAVDLANYAMMLADACGGLGKI